VVCLHIVTCEACVSCTVCNPSLTLKLEAAYFSEVFVTTKPTTNYNNAVDQNLNFFPPGKTSHVANVFLNIRISEINIQYSFVFMSSRKVAIYC